MNITVTAEDVDNIAKRCGAELTAERAGAELEHLKGQLRAFSVLYGVDVEGVAVDGLIEKIHTADGR